jgi:nitroreductase
MNSPSVVSEVIKSRKSVRSYTSQDVPIELIREILEVSSRSPSGSNTQPWNVYVLKGSSKETLSKNIITDFEKETAEERKRKILPFQYSPLKWVQPYTNRRIEIAEKMYTALGIEYEDIVKRQEHYRSNFRFFGAPVGLLFTMDSRLASGSLLDYGMFLENIMLLAQSYGLATCSIGFFSEYPNPVVETLKLNNNELVLCGMAIGYENIESPVNHLQTPRVSVDSFVSFLS